MKRPLLFTVILLSLFLVLTPLYAGRYYVPEIGRFSTPDPALKKWHPAELIRFQHGSLLRTSSYVYANDNPIMFIDPNGEATLGVHLGISGTKFFAGGSIDVGFLIDTEALSSGDWENAFFFQSSERGGLKLGIGGSARIKVSYSEQAIEEGVRMSLGREATVIHGVGLTLSDSAPSDTYGELTKSVSVGFGKEYSGGVQIESSQTIKATTLWVNIKNFFSDLFKGD